MQASHYNDAGCNQGHIARRAARQSAPLVPSSHVLQVQSLYATLHMQHKLMLVLLLQCQSFQESTQSE